MAIYLNLGSTIPGTATDSNFTGWIVLDHFAWGVVNKDAKTGVGSATSRQGSGVLTPDDLTCSKEFDTASVPILKQMFMGLPVAQAVLSVTPQASDNNQTYLQYTMYEVMVTQFHQGAGGTGLPSDNFQLNFTKLEVRASPTDSMGNAIPSVGGYDFKTSSPL